MSAVQRESYAEECATKQFSRNLVISPLSLKAVIAMLASGYSGRPLDQLLTFVGSKTVDELISRFSESSSVVAGRSGEGCPKISFVNRAWIDKRFSFQPSYERRLRDIFKSEATKIVDFRNKAEEAVRDINAWAEHHTNGIIKDVIELTEYTPSTTVVLGNALYFKGFWWDKFDTELTTDKDFHLLDGNTISAPFMTCSEYFSYGSFDDFKVVEVPYKTPEGSKKRFSMQFILPHKRDGLKNLLENFYEDSEYLSRGLNLTKIDVFWVPKFKFSYSPEDMEFPFMKEAVELTEMLRGVEGVPFDLKIIQKAFLQVDEEGTEAAAVTLAEEEMCCSLYSDYDVIRFVADHPFLFIIREYYSGLVLFVGAVLNPLKAD